MSREEAIKELTELLPEEFLSEYTDAIKIGIKALEQEPCEDAVSRQVAINIVKDMRGLARADVLSDAVKQLKELPPVTPQPKMGHCKDCKYFEYDSVAEVHGIPLIIAHEICKRWSDGCKTSEDGYCFLFEPQEGSDKE